MKENNVELKLTDICRYDDVELGRLVLSADGHSKSWKAIWLSHLMINGVPHIPRDILNIRYRNYRWIINCPRLKLNRRHSMWIMPLDSNSWAEFSVNLYLCADEGWPHPLSRREYEQMVRVLCELKVGELTVEKPQQTFDSSWFSPDVRMGLENFWDK